MTGKYLKIYPILLSFFVLSVCCNTQDSRKQPNIAGIPQPKPTLRLEQLLYQIPEGETFEGLNDLHAQYPELMDFFIHAVMNVSDTSEVYIVSLMDEFIHHPQMVELYDTIQYAFRDFNQYEEELSLLIRNYQYYFPKHPVPELMTFISQFGPKSFYYPPYLGVGLDLYLGENYKYYASMEFPMYFIKRLQPKYIASDAAFNIAQDLKEEPLKRGATLLDMMIHYGKIYYIASMLLPEKNIQDFFYYDEEQWTWCKDNEKEIWSFFIQDDWLYAKQYIQYAKFIEDGPTTMGMPQGAPDRVGRWTGYQIVLKYMAKHSELSLSDLMQIESGQKILKESGYKPLK